MGGICNDYFFKPQSCRRGERHLQFVMTIFSNRRVVAAAKDICVDQPTFSVATCEEEMRKDTLRREKKHIEQKFYML